MIVKLNTVLIFTNLLKIIHGQEGISDNLRDRLKTFYGICQSENSGCLGMPTGCIVAFEETKDLPTPTTCTAILRWTEVVGGRFQFGLNGNLGTSGYVAMGFSEDMGMGKDSVAVCLAKNGVLAIQRNVNENGHSGSVPFLAPELGITNSNLELLEGYIFCYFDQTNHNITGIINVDLAQNSYYYLLAQGPTSEDFLVQYHTTRVISDAKIKLVPEPETPTPTTQRNSAVSLNLSILMILLLSACTIV